MNEALIKAITDLNEDKVKKMVKEELKKGVTPEEILAVFQRGMDNVGNLYEESEYFIADLIMAGIIFREILDLEEMKFDKSIIQKNSIGDIVLGTVKGDLHDIGKDIFADIATSAGFVIHDLGVDVDPVNFVQKIRETNAKIVGMSGVLSLAISSMKETVDAIEKAGLRNNVKIIAGGNLLNEDAYQYIGADAFANNATEGLKMCKKWMNKDR
ncbi:cobalamin B12-binding domain-containing protein [Alkalibacter saccharofermentans]|uniref:Methanogenic corrinoid protein MtbC1 n=1 Tax=Alkalibacter saccharofermentans DSM 14828 TaxID=1120975 RepID=A0A1M4X8X5_9FIRM|nr:cobalamin-dependent protein [Alkalibacter saccharofermentans]SHE89855.1 Methanogenic corrinoid protein MtbC1 [Alkalibacter saccharofermentans DSM 14828]